jgi:hypothetical protein
MRIEDTNPALHALASGQHWNNAFDLKCPLILPFAQANQHSIAPCAAEQVAAEEPCPSAKHCPPRDARHEPQFIVDQFFQPRIACHDVQFEGFGKTAAAAVLCDLT